MRSTKNHLEWILVWLALFATTAAFAGPGDVTVTVDPFPAPTVSEFPPNTPPTNPPLRPGEAADHGFDMRVLRTSSLPINTVQTGNPDNPFKATVGSDLSYKATVTQNEIRQPNNAGQDLTDHEMGHSDLTKDEYMRSAKKKVEEAFRGFPGSMYLGATAQEAQQKVAKEERRRKEAAENAIKMQTGILNEKYDKITAHGKGPNATPLPGLDTETGKTFAKAERDGVLSGLDSLVPNSHQDYGGINDPISVSLDFDRSSLSFGGDSLLDLALSPMDSILGRGRVQLDPVIWIGLAENGTVHLSDTTLQIFDNTTGDLLMDAFVFNLYYMPSSLPGFPGMIQGGLDIPPDFAGGIHNSIGSDFLAGMQSASAGGAQTGLWFFPKRGLFDSRGTSQFNGESITGTLIIGLPTPEPSTLTLFLVGLVGLAWYLRHNRIAGRPPTA